LLKLGVEGIWNPVNFPYHRFAGETYCSPALHTLITRIILPFVLIYDGTASPRIGPLSGAVHNRIWDDMATRKIINPSITHVVVGGNKEVEFGRIWMVRVLRFGRLVEL
jgi:hypothetical protein